MPQGSLRRLPVGGVVLAFLAGLLLAGLLNLPGFSAAQQQDSRYAAGTTTPPQSAAVASLQSLSEAFASVAEAVKPSVVFIKSGKRNDQDERSQPRPQLPPGFEEFMPRLPQMQPPEFQEAAGSGFIVSRDGYILTNDHVVDGSDDVTVRLLDRREFKAKVIGTDPGTDLAVLKIDATNLTPAPMGDSDAARVGEWVLAVGNPLGENLTFTVTSGIISAKGRTLQLPNVNDRSIQDFIQTDAAINPGNSGGPLVSASGRVLGVNSAIASRTGFYSGYGFAIPINMARQVMDQIISHGEVRRSVRPGRPTRPRPLALTMPEVTVNWSCPPSGLPMASTHSPTRAASLLPSAAGVRPSASILRTATSVFGSVPITLALKSRRSSRWTVTRLAPSTTWLLVRM